MHGNHLGLGISIWPFLNTVVLAFTDAPAQACQIYWADEFVTLFSDRRFGYALTASLVYVLVCVPLLTFITLLLALLVEKRFQNFYFPDELLLPGHRLGRDQYHLVLAVFDSKGLINQSLQIRRNDGPLRLTSSLIAGSFSSVVNVADSVGRPRLLRMVVYLAALADVNKELPRNTALDGAGAWRRSGP